LPGIQITLAEIAERIGAKLVGPDATVSGVATLEDAGPSQLSLCFDRRRINQLKETQAAGVLVPARAKVLIDQATCPVLLVENPRLALARVLEYFLPSITAQAGIADGAWVDPNAEIADSACIQTGALVGAGTTVGARTQVESGVVIGKDVVIGQDCEIGANTVIKDGCVLGNRIILGPSVVIGSAGFGFVTDGDRYRRMPQIGNVVIEDDVEIGANTTVDRGTLGATRIGSGTKIDNLVQVGHNVVIGRRVIIAAQVGLSGSVTIEDGAVLGGQAGVADHIVIGKNAEIGAKSGVGSHIPEGARVAGYPAMEVNDWLRSVFHWRRMHRRPK
jgi:UDP-3-O-[3-hydroxymyristoyl] glucosamine N-acyltransferase